SLMVTIFISYLPTSYSDTNFISNFHAAFYYCFQSFLSVKFLLPALYNTKFLLTFVHITKHLKDFLTISLLFYLFNFVKVARTRMKSVNMYIKLGKVLLIFRLYNCSLVKEFHRCLQTLNNLFHKKPYIIRLSLSI